MSSRMVILLGRVGLRNRKLWLDYMTFRPSYILGEVAHVLWCNEYQGKGGNLPDTYGLVPLKKAHMDNVALHKIIYNPHQCFVCELFPTHKTGLH